MDNVDPGLRAEFAQKERGFTKLPDGSETKFFRGWNELKLTGKLPERRSYTTGCVQDGQMYIFGG